MSVPLPDNDPLQSAGAPEGPGQDGLEILLNMAKTGQMDPWNIDIVTVADEYLKAVAELKASDLKITGKTLLYLAILLRMKSDQLAGIDYLEPAPQEAFLEDLLDGDINRDGHGFKLQLPYKSLDELIQRRTSMKQKRIRRVTLNDLLLELKKYEDLERQRNLRRKVERDDERRNITDYSDLTSDDIEELAHEEFIEDTILMLKAILERLLIGQEAVSLTELMTTGKIDKVSAFLALLFLASRGEADLHQENFYEELYVSLDTENDVVADAEIRAAG